MADLGLPGRKKPFDPQQRLEAIHAPLPVTDKDALAAQIAGKQASSQEEQRRNREADAYREAIDARAVELERQRQGMNAEERRRVAEVQAAQAAQAAATAKASAAHVAAPNPGAAGVSSLRQFDGEDREFLERKRAQQSQQAGWTAQAQALSAAQAQVRAAQAAAEHATMQAQLAYGDNAFAAHAAARAAAGAATGASNAALAAEKRDPAAAGAATGASNAALAAEKRDKDAAAAAERAATHMVALVVDDGPNANAPRTEFRGYTPEQLGGVLSAQEAQRQELAARRGAAAAADRSAAVHDALVRKAQEKAVADVEAFKQQQRLAVAASVEAQRAQKERADQASTAAHKQPNMSAQFLDNFGRSAR